MIQSLEKALALLNAIAANGDWIGVRELSRQTGIKPPTAQQLLKTLQAARYLDFDESSRRYRLGIAALTLSHGAEPSERFGEIAKPFVDALFDEFGETTIALANPRGTYSCVCSRHCEKALGTSVPSAGDIERPHLMACGQALMAWQGQASINAYLKTKCARGEAANLSTLLEKARSTGIAELIDFNASAVAAYGVPVFDATGNAALAIGWSIPLARFDGKLKARIVPRLLKAAAQLGEALGAKAAQ